MRRTPNARTGRSRMTGGPGLVAVVVIGAILGASTLLGSGDRDAGEAASHEPTGARRSRPRARSPLTAAARTQLDAARVATAKYRDAGRAVLDGYRLYPGRGCVSGPTGLMGYHFVNSENLYDGRQDLGRPDYLLYAPTTAGGFALAGVEWEEPARGAPPKMFGQQFDGPMAGHVQVQPAHYDLHVWLHRPNPNGVFARYNPALSCCPPERPGAERRAPCPDPEAPFLGAGSLRPRAQRVRVNATLRWTLTWTHPDDRRQLTRAVVRLLDGRAEIGRAILDLRSGTIRTGGAGVVLKQAESGVDARPGRRLTARLALRVPRRLAGRRLAIELVVRDVRGREQQLNPAATVDVRGGGA